MNHSEQDFNQRILNLEKQVESIAIRNSRVELDKAWEVSKTRKIAILLSTYFLAAVVFYIMNVSNFLMNAFVPSIGFYLSTVSLPFLKKIWLKLF